MEWRHRLLFSLLNLVAYLWRNSHLYKPAESYYLYQLFSFLWVLFQLVQYFTFVGSRAQVAVFCSCTSRADLLVHLQGAVASKTKRWTVSSFPNSEAAPQQGYFYRYKSVCLQIVAVKRAVVQQNCFSSNTSLPHHCSINGNACNESIQTQWWVNRHLPQPLHHSAIRFKLKLTAHKIWRNWFKVVFVLPPIASCFYFSTLAL